jgi:DHA1 family inner membrane transport protein
VDRRILILAFAGFAMGTEAYVYAGHLDALAAELGQPVAAAGQLATAFALTYAVSAPLIDGFVARFGRRAVLTSGLVLIGVLNLFAAFAPSLGALIGLRVLAGLAAGLVGPISSVAAAELAGPEHRGPAMAIVLSGMTLAFVLGIPTGSVIGDFAGWRGTFVYAGVTALVAAFVIRLVLPRMPGGRRADATAFRAALAPSVAGPLALTLIGFAATFSTIAYVGPVVTAISGLTGSGIGAMQALIGVGSLLGVLIGGIAADKPGATRLLAAAAAMSLYSVLMWTGGADASQPLTAPPRLVYVAFLALGMIAGAAALFARTPVIQARLAAAAPAAAHPVIFALNGSMVFFGQGLGAGLGGATIAIAGISAIGCTAAAVALLGAGLVLAIGPKQSSDAVEAVAAK